MNINRVLVFVTIVSIVAIIRPGISLGASWFESEVESDERFLRSRDFAQGILKDFDPDHYVFLGLGRTTGVVSEWLRQLSQRNDYVFEEPIEEFKQLLKLTPEKRHVVLKKIIPPLSVLKGRHLLIHRVLWQGHTMKAVLPQILEFMKTEGYPFPLQVHFVTGNKPGSLLMTKMLEKSSFSQWIKLNFVHDRKFQDPFTDELYSDSNIKGMTLIGKYKAPTVLEMLSPDYQPKENPYYRRLSETIRTEICKSHFSTVEVKLREDQ